MALIKQANVLGVGVHVVDMKGAAVLLAEQIRSRAKGYVCLTGVHGVMEAQRNPGLKAIFADAFLSAPDGMPTVWMGRLQGLRTMRRVFGPDLMLEVIGGDEFRNVVHFFCGGEPGVAEALRNEMLRRFPWAVIAGTYSPPFRPMNAEEEKDLATRIGVIRPDIIWVGLSTPKQEYFMARYLPLLDTKLMVGVGAAFLFHTGAIQDSPDWVKRAGLQWMHRLFQEPSRLWKRYLVNNPRFIVLALLQSVGVTHYRLESRPQRAQPCVDDLR